MIDVEKCRACTNICPLVENGITAKVINKVAAEGQLGASAMCHIGPEPMEGGWTKCNTSPEAAAALRGAAVIAAASAEHNPTENLVTV